MALIIPYNEEIAESDGGFITPEGKFISNGWYCHDIIAANICKGPEYDNIQSFLTRYELNELYYPNETQDILKKYNVNSVDELDKYITSKLSKEELEKYKKWDHLVTFDDKWKVFFREKDPGFLHRFLRYDKLETIRRQTITTNLPFYHIRFFEWLVMGWEIHGTSYAIFDEKDNVVFRDYAQDKRPSWTKDINTNLANISIIRQIEQENWSYSKRLEFLKTYK